MKLRDSSRLHLLSVIVGVALVAGLLFTPASGLAVQNPRLSLDMLPDGNGYVEATNTMVVGTIENCLTTGPPGDNGQHNHLAHVVVHDVEDLVGWQVRLNYDGGRMRPASFNFRPFTDNIRGQGISFVNLPLQGDVHAEIIEASDIPPPAPGPQTSLAGSTYLGDRTAASAPDTPPKAPPDDASYSAPGGGVVAALNVQVLPGQAGQSALQLDMDDNNPNNPGSTVVVFDGFSERTFNLAENALVDGFHAEGTACTAPPRPPGPGAGGGNGGDGDAGQPSPGEASPGADGDAVPGATTPAADDGATGEEEDEDAEGEDAEAGEASENGDDDGDGIPIWAYILAALAAVAATSAVAAWRFRARIPWLKRWL